jgi:DNA-binding XRE family transcriptional regulator
MELSITINGQTLPVLSYEGQRVVTYKDVATVHQVEEKTIRNNFANNRKHFKEGIDFFLLRGKKACQNIGRASYVTQINVFTESGYLMLAKSLTDDLSWQVQRELVNNYFKNQGQAGTHRDLQRGADRDVRVPGKRADRDVQGSGTIAGRMPAHPVNETVLKLFPMLDPLYKHIIYYRLEKGLTQNETAKLLGIGRGVVQSAELELNGVGIYLPKQSRMKLKLTVTRALMEVLNEDEA